MEKNPRWMTRIGLVLILVPLIRNLVFIASSFQVEQTLVENTNIRLVAHVSTVLGMLFLLPELRTRLAPLACLFLLTLLPLQSHQPNSGDAEFMLAMGVLIVGWAFMAYSVGGSARLYFIIGCLSSWLFAIAWIPHELDRQRKIFEMMTEQAIHIIFALALGGVACLVQHFVALMKSPAVQESEQRVNGS
ncbi:MAG: hypothetical protein HUJ26_11985 [Planctomycetaceae bacterium]|nr:hypothetical protein [Planctomycetaceae bacterium]